MTALLPKEHGAWAQMALPLITVTAVAGPSFISLAVLAGFLAHEPALVLLGARGPRARRAHGQRAAWWLATLLTAGLGAGALGLARLGADARWTVLLPAVPALAIGVELWRQHPKSALSEVAAAAAVPLAAVPAALSAGAPAGSGYAVALPFLGMFVVATLAVRGVTRAGHDTAPSGVSSMSRGPVVGLAVAAALALFAAVDRDVVPPAAALAALPGLAVSVAVVLVPPHPRHLRRVGWLLAGASVATTVVLVTTG